MSHSMPNVAAVPTGPPRPQLHPLDPLTAGRRVCQNPNCRNAASEEWDDAGRLCGRCAIEKDLFDRETRRERCFPQ